MYNRWPVRCLFQFSPPDRASRALSPLYATYKGPLAHVLTAFFPLIYAVTALCLPPVTGWAAEPPGSAPVMSSVSHGPRSSFSL